ncbi:hypothetical protein [Caballeronia grimmiae]|uniref:Uncharacterized protein n=1 Tax=Caballeronia grimmiae TaxID=1071679 RepID=A0ABQ1SA89_9BURK|nr:hypothetical protein [Caballeronia grimmiae]GGD98302.1 hypothetical protein GCM10010985_61330 [Caballeronia grimmiae]
MTRIYATLRKRYTTQALKDMGFVKDGGLMVRAGRCVGFVRRHQASMECGGA